MSRAIGAAILFAAAFAVIVTGMWIADEAEAPQGIIVSIGTGLLVAMLFPSISYGERFITWLSSKVRRFGP